MINSNSRPPPLTLSCSLCSARFTHQADLKHHTRKVHKTSLGDEVLAQKFGEFSFFEATLVSHKPLIVRPKGHSEEICVRKFILPNAAYDPSVFIQNYSTVAPLALKPKKTIEEELEDKESIRDDSSVTSEALSVDISSEASFPCFSSAKTPFRQKVQEHQMLPLYEVVARVQVRAYITSDSLGLCRLEKGMTFHVLKTFEDFSVSDVVEFWRHRFPEFNRSPTLWAKNGKGKKLAKMKVEALRRVFHLNQEQAKLVRNSVRLAKRRVKAVFTLDSMVQCGWVALVKGKKLLARRIFGKCAPTLLLKNLFVSREFSRDAPSRERTFHKMLLKYRSENKNCVSVDGEKRTFFQNPSQTWYEETLASMLKEAGAKIKKVMWNGDFTESFRHGSETGKVRMSKMKSNGRMKSFLVDRRGYTIPDTYAFVTFRNHNDLKNFLAIDFSSFIHEDLYPLFSMTAELDRTYANLSLAPVV